MRPEIVQALDNLIKGEPLASQELVEAEHDATTTYYTSYTRSGEDCVVVEQAARRVLSHMPDSIRAMDVLGVALEQQGRYEEAIECFKSVLEAAPAYAHAHFTKALAMFKSGKDLQTALAEFELLVTLNPNDYKALNMVGECYRRRGEMPKAIDAFKKALAINPQSIVALMAISTAFVHTGRSDSAIYFANQAVEFYPSDPEAWEIRGDVLAAAGQSEQGLESWTKSMLLGGLTSRLFEKLRGPLLENGKAPGSGGQQVDLRISSEATFASSGGTVRYTTDEAGDGHESQLEPDSAPLCANRGSTHYALGEYEKALAEFNRAIQLDPDLVQARTGRGCTRDWAGMMRRWLTITVPCH
jgi:tetratricopeptide (TPR) repeat protein